MIELPEYSEGVAYDGAAILKDGVPLAIEEILQELRKGAKAEAERDAAVRELDLLKSELVDLAKSWDLDGDWESANNLRRILNGGDTNPTHGED